MITVTVFTVVVVFMLLLYIQSGISFDLSDHYYHLALIKGIKKNKHRFLAGHPNFIGEKNFAYPQLFHWLCSFLPARLYTKYQYVPGLLVNLLIVFSFMGFVWLLYLLGIRNGSVHQAILYTGLLFVLAPFSYAGWNAKNKGVSARGFGLLGGHVYNYVLVGMYFFDHPLVYVMTYASILVILLSSQFTLQYLVFSLIPYSIMLGSFNLIFIFLAAMLTFLAIMPLVFRRYFAGQIWHKRIFAKYLVDGYVLSARYSIWRDLVWDLYKKIAQQGKAAIRYVLYQPLLYLFIGIPANAVILYAILTEFPPALDSPFMGILLVCLLLFLITSFRKTRFLGEPERYVEFAIPVSTIVAYDWVTAHGPESLLPGLIIFGILIIAVQFFLTYNTNKKIILNKNKMMDEVVASVMTYTKGKGRLLSNSWHMMRRFYGSDIQTLTPVITSEYTGKFHITEIFRHSFTYISEEVIDDLIHEFMIEYLLLDRPKTTDEYFTRAKNNYQVVYENDEYCIFDCRR